MHEEGKCYVVLGIRLSLGTWARRLVASQPVLWRCPNQYPISPPRSAVVDSPLITLRYPRIATPTKTATLNATPSQRDCLLSKVSAGIPFVLAATQPFKASSNCWLRRRSATA